MDLEPGRHHQPLVGHDGTEDREDAARAIDPPNLQVLGVDPDPRQQRVFGNAELGSVERFLVGRCHLEGLAVRTVQRLLGVGHEGVLFAFEAQRIEQDVVLFEHEEVGVALGERCGQTRVADHEAFLIAAGRQTDRGAQDVEGLERRP